MTARQSTQMMGTAEQTRESSLQSRKVPIV